MFTGLIEATGRIDEARQSADGGRLRIATALGSELQAGDSVAVNGVCLTALDVDVHGFAADVSPVTLAVTALGQLKAGSVVNLERPVRADARMGGHFVLGHVDATGTIRSIDEEGEAWRLVVSIPQELEPLVIPRGSIAIDGISLTIAAIDGLDIALQIIPFTFGHTTLGQSAAGDLVNLEADVLGKYVLRAAELGGLDRAAGTPS